MRIHTSTPRSNAFSGWINNTSRDRSRPLESTCLRQPLTCTRWHWDCSGLPVRAGGLPDRTQVPAPLLRPAGSPQPFWSAASWHTTRPRHGAAQLLNFNRVLNTQRKLGAESALRRPAPHLLLHRPLPLLPALRFPAHLTRLLLGPRPCISQLLCRDVEHAGPSHAGERQGSSAGGRHPPSLPPCPASSPAARPLSPHGADTAKCGKRAEPPLHSHASFIYPLLF